MALVLGLLVSCMEEQADVDAVSGDDGAGDVTGGTSTQPSRGGSPERGRGGDHSILTESSKIDVDVDVEFDLGDAELEKPSEDAVLLFESIRRFEDGELVLESVAGELTPEDQLRAARPYRHLHELWLFEEQTWTRHDEGGEVEHGLRVWLRPNVKPAADPMTLEDQLPGPPSLGPEVASLLESDWAEDERHLVTVLLRGFPEWDVPLRPRPEALGLEAAAAAQAARDLRLEQRQSLHAALVAPLVELVESTGGEAKLHGGASGWSLFEVSKDGLVALVAREDLRSIALEDGIAENGWPLGTGREDARVDAGDYLDAGYDGSGPSGGSRIKIAFVEAGTFQSEACAFRDGANCSGASRIVKKYDCAKNAAAPFCVEDTDPGLERYVGENTDPSVIGNHGTAVVALALADYEQNQGQGQLLGDTTTSHSSTWELYASGYAPEAQGLYYGNIFQSTTNLSIGRVPRHAEAFGLAVSDGADIISFSQGTGAQRCHPSADLSSEQAAEDAFDDGVLIAACTGNFDPAASDPALCDTSCGTWSVGSLAKTLAIAGFRSQDTACTADFADCRKDFCPQRDGMGVCTGGYSACRGGASVKIDGTTHSGAASLTDLLMPTHVTSVTRYDQTAVPKELGLGVVSDTATAGGCSSATPQFAGLAASIKDYHLSSGHTWIDNPGRLQSVLLLLGDRSYATQDDGVGTIDLRSSGTSALWGLGRARARLWGTSALSPSLLTTYVKSYTPSSSAETFRPFVTTAPLPTGVDLVKCTLLQMEDFSGEALPVTVSDVNLSLTVRDTVSGSCSSGTGTLRYTRSDNGADWKKLAAITSSQTTLAGRCVYVTLTPAWVESQGVSSLLSCAYMGALESEG